MLRVTASLLNAFKYWQNNVDGEWGDSAYQSFIDTLSRKPFEPSDAMREGIEFERLCCAVADGKETSDLPSVNDAADIIKGGVYQVRFEKVVTVDDKDYLLVGVADIVKGGVCMDLKHTSAWEAFKFADSPQTSSYFAGIDGLTKFMYLISERNKEHLFIEVYYPEQVKPIEQFIKEFVDTISGTELFDIYVQNWTVGGV